MDFTTPSPGYRTTPEERLTAFLVGDLQRHYPNHEGKMMPYPTRVEEPHIWLAMFHRIGYRNAAGAGLTAPTRSFLYRGASIRFHHENICGLDIVNRPASRT